MSELNPNMQKVLRALRDLRDSDSLYGYPATPNAIAYQAGYRPGMARHGNHGQGNVARVMGPAVHVTPALTALRKRGLVDFAGRPDGWSGTAYYLTEAGERAADGP